MALALAKHFTVALGNNWSYFAMNCSLFSCLVSSKYGNFVMEATAALSLLTTDALNFTKKASKLASANAGKVLNIIVSGRSSKQIDGVFKSNLPEKGRIPVASRLSIVSVEIIEFYKNNDSENMRCLVNGWLTLDCQII